MTHDPTRMREQPALTTSSGAIWLIVGGLFAAISLGVLVPMTFLPAGGGIALGAAIAVAALYVAMIVMRLAVRGRRRLQLMAAAMIVMAVVALVAVWLVADAQVN
jgi:hypothetical protein